MDTTFSDSGSNPSTLSEKYKTNHKHQALNFLKDFWHLTILLLLFLDRIISLLLVVVAAVAVVKRHVIVVVFGRVGPQLTISSLQWLAKKFRSWLSPIRSGWWPREMLLMLMLPKARFSRFSTRFETRVETKEKKQKTLIRPFWSRTNPLPFSANVAVSMVYTVGRGRL